MLLNNEQQKVFKILLRIMLDLRKENARLRHLLRLKQEKKPSTKDRLRIKKLLNKN